MFQGSWSCRSFGCFCNAEGEGFVGAAVAGFGTNSAVPRSVGSCPGGLSSGLASMETQVLAPKGGGGGARFLSFEVSMRDILTACPLSESRILNTDHGLLASPWLILHIYIP